VIQDENQQNIPVPDNYRHYVYLKAHSKTIANAAILRNTAFLVASNGEHPQIRKGLRISPNFFSILGVSPFLGRNFLAEEGQAGRNNVVLISWSTWQDLFFHDAGVVGRILKVNGKEQTIVGVLPKDFEFPNLNEMPGGTSSNERSTYQIFQPFVAQGDDLTADDADFAFLVLARLRSGATIREANSELGGMLGAYALANHLSVHPGVAVAPFSQEVTGNIRNALWLLLAAVLGLLLIASVNLASLQVARAFVRDRDNALRAALGAGRVRLLQATFMESLYLSVIGGVTGILLALAGIRVFVAIAPENLPRLHQIHLSWQVMLFACGVSVGTATLSGIFPALHSFRVEPQRALQAGSARLTHTGQAASARRALITIEIACTAVLLVVTGLVVRSLSRVVHQHRYFEANRMTIAEADLFHPVYQEGSDSGIAARSGFIDRVLERVRSNPEVESAAITSKMPLTGEDDVHSMYRPDHPLRESEVPTANLRDVSPGYFETMQTPLLAGHGFTEADRLNGNDAVISERAAKLAWPDSQALGRKFKINGRIYTVTGIARDARIASLKENVPVVYLPFWNDPPGTVFFLIRSTQSSEALAPAIRRAIWEIDPEVAIPSTQSLATQMTQSISSERLQTAILSCFGAAALFLAILGVYGVLAYSVSLRTPEFGVRIALGSSKPALIRLVLREALIPACAGIALGALGSIGAAHAIRSLLFETSAADPLSIAASFGLLLLAVSLAAFLPAYQAAKIDPMQVLHNE
jgi:predicted permease